MAEPLDSVLQDGIAAARAGDRAQARSLLKRVVEGDERNLPAWYWLSRVVESAEEREICLENVLALDPAHMVVQAELVDLRHQQAEAGRSSLLSREVSASTSPGTAEAQLASDAAIEPLSCPYCGGTAATTDRRCSHCLRALHRRKPKSEDHSVYSLGLVVLWLISANLVWLGLTLSYLLSGLVSILKASPGVVRTLETLMRLLGIEGAGLWMPKVSLLPIVLIGGGLLLFSLIVAWGLYRRLRLFYWLTVALILLCFLLLVYAAVSAETLPLLGLVAGSGGLLLTIGFAFMAYDEFAWVNHRLDAAVDRDVDGHSALYARGQVYARQGMWAKAAAHWSKAVALNPAHIDYRLALATAYLNLAQIDRAREHLEAVQQTEPDNARARELLESVAP